MAVSSMTGSASIQVNTEDISFTLNINTVNNRYLDIFLKLPDNLRYLDLEIRKLISSKFSRGKFDLSLNLNVSQTSSFKLNEEELKALGNVLKTIQNTVGGNINPMEILNYRGILVADENIQEKIVNLFYKALDNALSQLKENRLREGEQLKNALENLLSKIESNLDELAPILENLVNAERRKIKERIDNLKINIDESRIEQEVALAAQKADIREEYDRLRSHIKEARRVLNVGGVIGKRLDFLLQEFNREANTMASKASSLDITRIAVDTKVLIEQIREQVQNIE